MPRRMGRLLLCKRLCRWRRGGRAFSVAEGRQGRKQWSVGQIMTEPVWLARLLCLWKVTNGCERVWAVDLGKLSWLPEWTSDVGVATFEKGEPAAVCAYT